MRLENLSTDLNLSGRTLTQITSGFARMLAEHPSLNAAAYVSVSVQDGVQVNLESSVIAPDGAKYIRQSSVSQRKVMVDTLAGDVFAHMLQNGGILSGTYTYEVYSNGVLLGRTQYSVADNPMTAGITLSGATLYASADARSELAQLAGGETVLVDEIVFGKGRRRGYFFHAVWENVEGYISTGEVMINASEIPALPAAADEQAQGEARVAFGETMAGYGGEISVKVDLIGNQIVGIETVHAYESIERGMPAIEEIARRMIESNSADVETVSGATITSKAMIRAVRDALDTL